MPSDPSRIAASKLASEFSGNATDACRVLCKAYVEVGGDEEVRNLCRTIPKVTEKAYASMSPTL
jgi:hypothetical protein